MLEIFRIVQSQLASLKRKNAVILIQDNWDDWGRFNTQYLMVFADSKGDKHTIGYVKIGCPNEKLSGKRPSLPDSCPKLPEGYFSLGQSDRYYENLKALTPSVMHSILNIMNDIVWNESLFYRNQYQDIMTESLQRYVATPTITGQFRNILSGRSKLSSYKFSCFANDRDFKLNIDFDVLPTSILPTNIHAIIGDNGVGKSHLLNSIIENLQWGSGNIKTQMRNDDRFANLIAISFSAFGGFESANEHHDAQSMINYSHIGINKIRPENENISFYRNHYPHDKYELGFDFMSSIQACKYSPKKEFLLDALNKLALPEIMLDVINDIINSPSQTEFDFIRNNEHISFFNKLSSGHKIVILTLTSLVEKIQEKSLVLFDEPEVHLHPPMLANLVRALSDLLISTNGVAVLATHSPVVLQEISRDCVTILNRPGITTRSCRPEYETFGENVSLLTHRIFMLDNDKSGYVSLIKRAVSPQDSFTSALEKFDGKLGSEAITILSALTSR